MIYLLWVVGIYLIASIFIYASTAGADFISYKRTGTLDNKFPINSIETHKILALFSIFWFPIVCYLLKEHYNELKIIGSRK